MPLSLEMKMMRPQLRLRMNGRYKRASRAPLKTLTSKKRFHSSSLISSKGLTSKIPRLFTRMSTCGCCRTSFSATDAELKSPANPMTSPPAALFMAVTAASTAVEVLPLTITLAPSRASAAAMAWPMPAVEPLTSAILPFSCRSMRSERRVHGHRIQFVHNALLHHKAHALHEADVIDGIAGNRDHIRDLTSRHAPQVLVVPQQCCRIHRRSLDDEHRRHARPHHQLELMRVLAVRIHGGVRAERDFDV